MKPKTAITGAAIAAALAGAALAGAVKQFDVKLPRSRGSKYVPHFGAKQRLKAAMKVSKTQRAGK